MMWYFDSAWCSAKRAWCSGFFPKNVIADRSLAAVARVASTKVFQEFAAKAACRNSLDRDTFGDVPDNLGRNRDEAVPRGGES
jgi:hypothetical protein